MRSVHGAVRARRAQAGFTLVELMVSLVMFSFVIAGVLSVAVVMVNGLREQRLAVTTEAAARSAMDFLADGLRGASPAIETGAINRVDATGACVQNAFTLTNSASGPDRLEVVIASGSVATSTRTALAADGALTVTDASQIAAGDTLLISDFSVAHLVDVTDVTANDLTVEIQCAGENFPASGYPAGSMVVRVLHAELSIDLLDGIPTLFMNPAPADPAAREPLAEGIEDMQIALAIDTTSNGIEELGMNANDDEWWPNVAGELVPAPVVGAIRAVRITLVARASGQVTGTGAFYRPAAEDRPASASPDRYRRRVLTSIVEVRNLGGSP